MSCADLYRIGVYMENRFPELLEDRLIVLGLSDKELAELAEVDKSTVSRWKSGALKPIKGDIQQRLADALKVDARDINEAVKGNYLSKVERDVLRAENQLSPEAIQALIKRAIPRLPKQIKTEILKELEEMD